MGFSLSNLRVQRRITYLLIAIGFVVGIWRQDTMPDSSLGYGHVLDGIRARGIIVVLTRNAPTTFYFDQRGERAGYEYDLVEDFAATLGVETHYVVLDTVTDILEAMRAGEGDIAAAGLTRTEEREALYRFGPAYKDVRQQLVCNRRGDYPRRLADLPNFSLEVIANSSYEERLIELSHDYEELTWQASAALDTEGILARVAAGEVDCTVADSTIVAVNRRYEPDLIVPFDMSEPQQLAWVLPAGSVSLDRALQEWFADLSTTNFLSEIDERHYGHIEAFDYVDMARFKSRIQSRLPEFRQWFEIAGTAHDLPWTLLAALSYQESHWDAAARSSTGVRGLMMLTLAAADDMGVTNRLDAEQSIMGGATYLKRLYDRLPDEVSGDDRMLFALAAYNVGFGHVMDAMRLARQMERDDTSWLDLQEMLPLLSRRAHYRGLRYGYARGGQAVIYVQRVRDYWDILNREFPSHAENTGSAFPQPEAEEVEEATPTEREEE